MGPVTVSRCRTPSGPMTTDRTILPFVQRLNSCLCSTYSFILEILLSLLWLYSPLLGLRSFFSFLILYIVGRIPWTGEQPVARPLPTQRTIQTHIQKKEKHKHPCLEWYSNPRPSVWARENTSCFKQRGHCDWHSILMISGIKQVCMSLHVLYRKLRFILFSLSMLWRQRDTQ
jgi:hypothetical protein